MIICVTNRNLCRGDFLKAVENACNRSDMLILREKDLTESAYIDLAAQVSQICKDTGTRFYVHTFINALKSVSCQGIHLPFSLFCHNRDLPCKIGVSIHSVGEAIKAQQFGAEYVTAGHIFDTKCKKGVPARGLSFLCEVAEAIQIPVYAIGGMNLQNKETAIEAGAKGVCMMSEMMKD